MSTKCFTIFPLLKSSNWHIKCWKFWIYENLKFYHIKLSGNQRCSCKLWFPQPHTPIFQMDTTMSCNGFLEKHQLVFWLWLRWLCTNFLLASHYWPSKIGLIWLITTHQGSHRFLAPLPLNIEVQILHLFNCQWGQINIMLV